MRHKFFQLLGVKTELKAALLATTLVVSAASQAQLANDPLLTRAASVRPNLLFVLDDSGSMGGSQVYARHYELASGSCGTSNYSNSAPVNNLLYYDPSKRYEPGFSNTGAQLTNAPVPASFSTFTVYLPKPGQNIPALTTKSSKCESARYNTIEVRGSDFRVNGTSTSVNPFTYNANRTDCGAGPCTLLQEKQNITNWRTYHTTRIAAAKMGVGKAFTDQPDTFRLGYTTIHVADAMGGGTGQTKLTGVKDLNLVKTDFYTWLNSLSLLSGTPLRKALDISGQYYSRSDKNGPWAHSPWKSNSEGEAIKDHLSCRKSFTVLITDGEWNGDAAPTTAAQANVDGVTGPTLVHSDGVTKYTYQPGTTKDLRSIGKSDKKIPSSADYGNTLADAAMYYWMNDLRAGTNGLANNVTAGGPSDKPFWQNMTTYTGAFGPVGKLSAADVALAKKGELNWTAVQPAEDLPETIDDLIHAAHNGGGEFLTLTDASTFASELGRVVGSIAGEQFSQAGVAASAAALTTGTKKFVPRFTANLWWGNMEMVNLKGNGDFESLAWQVVEVDANKNPTGVTKIPSPATRKMYTWVNNSTPAVSFEYPSLVGGALIASGASNNTTTLLSNTMTPEMVAFLRGDRSNEGDGRPYRKRSAILGDIINSNPVFIKNVSDPGFDRLPAATPGVSSYAAYRADKLGRKEGAVFIGANDGMVHGFREGSDSTNGGQEIFAYVPRGVLGNMHRLADKFYQHRFFVDGPLVEGDAYINAPNFSGSGKSVRWTNLIMGTTGAGGRSVFALDATRPLQMNEKSILWEVNGQNTGYEDLGNVLSEVQTGITASGQWVAIVANGPYGNSGRAHLFVLDLATGAVIRKLDTNDDTANGLGGVRIVRNSNNQIIGAYAGDLKGNVWRFDLSATSAASWPNGVALYSAKDSTGKAQPITATPGVVPRTDGKSGYIVVVGTGKLQDENDQTDLSPQSAYGLWDTAVFGISTSVFTAITNPGTLVSVSVVTETANVTTGDLTFLKTVPSRTIDWAFDRGWYINYAQTPGQRTIYPVNPIGDVVRVDTLAPRANQFSCTVGTSVGYNYLISPYTGTCKTQTTLDTNGDGVIDDKDSVACIYSTEADGEDVVLETPDPSGSYTEIVDIQNSGGHLKARVRRVGVPPIPISGNQYRRDWRQLILRKN
jgi:type IV pilus assembly protein PilY1